MDIHPDYESAVRSSGLNRFDDFMTVRGGTPASRHRHRETLPIELKIDGKNRHFFLKRVFKVPPKHAFWPMVRLRRPFSQPAREWEICGQLQRAGIPVMKAVAVGERRRLAMPMQAFLLVEAVPIPHTVEDWLVPGFPKPAPIDPRLRERLLFDLGTLVRKLYTAGFDWPDIDAKHIFTEPDHSGHDAPSWHFRLIDVERMKRGPARAIHPNSPVPDDLLHACRALIQSLIPMRFDRADSKRFWSGLCSTGTDPGPSIPPPRDAPEDGASRLLQFVQMDRMPRMPDDYVHPRYMPLTEYGNIVADPRMISRLQQVGIHSLEDVFTCAAGTNMHKPGLGSHRERIRMEWMNEQGARRAWFLKRYLRPPIREQLRRLRRHGRKRGAGAIEARFIRRLSALGIPTMHTIAYGQDMSGLFERRGFILTEEIRGLSLEQLTRRILANTQPAPPWRERRDIIRQLAWITARLHAHRLYHRDLYLCHVFLCREAGTAPTVHGRIILRLIDLARMIERPCRRRRWIVKDLAALNHSAPVALVTRADRLRFLYDYDPSMKAARNHAEHRRTLRSMIFAIEARTTRMRRHDTHRARRLEPGLAGMEEKQP